MPDIVGSLDVGLVGGLVNWPFIISAISTTVSTAVTNNAVWLAWNNCIGGSVASSITSVTSATSSFAITDQTIWTSWCIQSVATEKQRKEFAILTDRYRKEEEKRLQEWNRQEAIRLEQEKAARARARNLLLQCLTKAQKETLEQHQYFDVEVAGKTYRIRQGTHGNVRLLKEGKEAVRYCIQPSGVPIEDCMLSQKLLLETDEHSFLRIANASQVRN
jgi:hypothetical protein